MVKFLRGLPVYMADAELSCHDRSLDGGRRPVI
jgi:hypothetical protein